jgi:hypothetical protein
VNFLVTTGFLEALGIPLSIGLVAAPFAVMNDWPKTTPAGQAVESRWDPWWLVLALTVGGFVPFVLVVVAVDGGWRKELWFLMPLLIATWAALLGGMRSIREAGEGKRHRRAGAVVVGLVVSIVTAPIVIGFAPVLGFPDARVCIRDSDPELEGGLVADTSDRVVLIRLTEGQRGAQGGRTIDSIPADLLERVDSGTLDDLPGCEGK